jgi:hypothetical protein
MASTAAAFASRSRALLSRARMSSAVVRACCNTVTITGSDRSSSKVGSRLLTFMVMFTPAAGRDARGSRRTGVSRLCVLTSREPHGG